MQSIVVVGASLAGLRAVEELRHQGYDGRITVIGDELHAPYDRPPLSKQVLAGDWEPDRIALDVPSEGGLDGLGVDWRLGTRAVGLDTWNRRVALADGAALRYEGLVIATGAKPRMLPKSVGGRLKRARGSRRGGAGRPQPDELLPGVHLLRTLDDCLAVRAVLDATPRRVVVIGAGFIGAEVAATCRERGLEVTLVEALDVPLQRAVGAPVGQLVAEIHRDHGVDVRLGVGVKHLDGGDRIERVRLADGTALDADLVVLGVGVTPATGWLEGSTISLEDGVVCDAQLHAAPGVVAAGDVARWSSARYASAVRVEHWENAITMGEHAARSLLGVASDPYDPVPWFWSDQYDRKLQLAGFAGGADEMLLVDGSLEERRFAAIFRRGDRIAGAAAMNRPRQLVTYRALVERNAPWDEAVEKARR
jgi:NADPH-dependent 2,4-dienoyl-CoA reductase/sulfur reductase-like enzyme